MSLKDHLNELIKYKKGQYCVYARDEQIAAIEATLKKVATLGDRECVFNKRTKDIPWSVFVGDFDEIYEQDIIEYFQREGLECEYRDSMNPNKLYITIPEE